MAVGLALAQMQQIQAQNQKLIMHGNEVELERRRIFQQLGDMQDKWASTVQENMRLQGELAAVRKALEVAQLLTRPIELSFFILSSLSSSFFIIFLCLYHLSFLTEDKR